MADDNITPIKQVSGPSAQPPGAPAAPRLTFTLDGKTTSFDADDKLDEIVMRANHIEAIADLVKAASGERLDASDSNVELLCCGTLRRAMYCIKQFAQQIEKIECAEVGDHG